MARDGVPLCCPHNARKPLVKASGLFPLEIAFRAALLRSGIAD